MSHEKATNRKRRSSSKTTEKNRRECLGQQKKKGIGDPFEWCKTANHQGKAAIVCKAKKERQTSGIIWPVKRKSGIKQEGQLQN